ncbi:MAG TPA: hypothetical protein VNA15_03395 [Candidatus Angelobacter sp.]|nr:hypothetical protein [Candidatus Angelobacter sp.]
MTRRLAFVTLLLVLAAAPLAVRGQSSPGNIDVTISDNVVKIGMSLSLIENFTSLPSFYIHLTPSNSKNVSQPVAAALSRLVPSAVVDSLDLSARTLLMNPTTNAWLLQENYTIQISGVNKNLGSTIEIDMSFLRMNVSQPINVQGVELNSLGAAYLLQPLLSLRAQQLQQRIQSTAYFIDRKTFTNTVVPGNTTLTFNLLDFTWILPLVGWAHQDEPFDSASTWTLPSNIANPYNLTVGFRLLESQYVPIYEAAYYASVQITAPAHSWAVGNTIMFDLPSRAEIAMPALLVAGLVVGIVSTVVDRRITKPFKIRRKRR